MFAQSKAVPEQKLTEIEAEALFILVDELAEKGWGYGASPLFRCGVFTGPGDEFDLRLSMRVDEHKLQWSLTYPSTVDRSEYEGDLRNADLPFSGHTLIWEYDPGATEQGTEENFLQAARESIAAITALPRF